MTDKSPTPLYGAFFAGVGFLSIIVGLLCLLSAAGLGYNEFAKSKRPAQGWQKGRRRKMVSKLNAGEMAT